ncbi:MAG: GGDEF domain-containing protein [Lachnospiraceae bacterium]|nr:GGDEF domain-containing protein [Lachnospiraceae bacterium]
MRDRSTANFNIIYAALVLIGILIIIASAMNPDESDARIIQNGALSYNKGWEYKNNYMEVYEECTLPLSLDKKGYMNLTVRKKLGRESQDGQYIMYRSVHATNTIFAGKRKIMTYADKQSTFFPLPGSAWIIVPLKDSYQGKYLTINLHRIEPKYGGIMEEVILGDRADMLERILVENIFGVTTCAMILFASVMLFLVAVMDFKATHSHKLFYLSAFTMGIFLWSINETHCTQLFIGNMEMVSIMTYEVLAMLSMPIILYYCNSRHRKVRDICYRLAVVPIINFLLINALHFVKMMDLSESLVITHISIFITGGVICYAHARAGAFGLGQMDSPLSDKGVIGFFILMITVLIDVFHYYSADYIDGSRYSRIGLLVFVLFLASDTLHNSLSDEIDLRKAEVYKTLTFTDNLTGLGNRQAYEQEIERINEREELLDHFVAAILDLNNLKSTNDSLGHAEGDRYIISSATLIQKYFGKIARIYRIGGDEFAILFTGHDSDVFLEMEANMFDDIMNGGRQDINFAYGSAVYNHITDRTAEDTIHRADEKMYASKNKYKHKSGTVI